MGTCGAPQRGEGKAGWGCPAAGSCGGEAKGRSLNACLSTRPGLAEGEQQPAPAAGPAAPSSRSLPLHPNRTPGKRVPTPAPGSVTERASWRDWVGRPAEAVEQAGV